MAIMKSDDCKSLSDLDSHPFLLHFSGSEESRNARKLLAHLFLEEYISCCRLEKDKNGKPYVKGFDGYISLSHSEDYAAACISDRPCGIDIEKLKYPSDALARRIFSDKEFASFKSSNESGLFFTKNWCELEALTKMDNFLIGRPLYLRKKEAGFYEKAHFLYDDSIICITRR